MKQPDSRMQNIISTLVIVLLVTQTVLLILVLINLRYYGQVLMPNGRVSQGDPIESLIGTQAPDFSATDVSGTPISLNEFKGNPALLVFSSHECSFCREMYPGLRQFLESNVNIEVLVLSVSSIEENQEFQAEFSLTGYENLYVLSATPEVFERYFIMGTPTFVVINTEGKIVKTGYARTAGQIAELTEGVK